MSFLLAAQIILLARPSVWKDKAVRQFVVSSGTSVNILNVLRFLCFPQIFFIHHLSHYELIVVFYSLYLLGKVNGNSLVCMSIGHISPSAR